MKVPAKGAKLMIHEKPLSHEGYKEPATLHGKVKILYRYKGEYFYEAPVKFKDGSVFNKTFGETDIKTA